MDISRLHNGVSTRTTAQQALTVTAQCAVITTAVVLTAFIAWSFDRGLELTDEAFYLLTSMHPHALRFFFTPTQWISGPLWQVAHGLAGFRETGWIFLTAGAAVLGIGVARSATEGDVGSTRTGPVQRSAIIATTMIFAWLYGAILPFSPSYNLLGAGGAYAALGFFLLSVDSENRRHVTALAAAIGICLAVAVLSKFSAGVATAGLIYVLLAIMPARQAMRWRVAVVTSALLVAAIAIVIVSESSFREAYQAFLSGLDLTRIAQGNETTVARLERGVIEWWHCLTFVGTVYWGPLVVACVAVVLRNAVVGCLSVAWLVYQVIVLHTYVGGMDVYQTQSRPLVAAMAVMLVLTCREWSARRRLIVLTASLSVLPFAIAVGTGNPMPFQILLALASWGALCSVLAFGTGAHSLRTPAAALALAFPLLVASQIVSSGYLAPYRLAQPLQAQRLPIDLGRLGTLKVDPETERFVTELRGAWLRCGLPPKMPYLGVYRLPGVAIVVDAVPVATPWLFSKPFTDAALNGVDSKKVRGAALALALTPEGKRPDLPDQLQSAFPSEYRFCGTFSLPFGDARAELWAPKHSAAVVRAAPSLVR